MTDACYLEWDERSRERLSRHDFDRNFLVSAGAGAGKTYLTVERAFHMLCDQSLGLSPSQIVLITFTRKAATEMKARMNRRILGALQEENTPERQALLRGLAAQLPEMQISTIHSFCQRVLRDYPLESGIGFAPQFDSEDGGPDSRSETFFDEAWRAGRCPASRDAGIPGSVALGAFRQMMAHGNVQPQFIDVTRGEGRERLEAVLETCRGLIHTFALAAGDADPSLFHFTIENALRAGEKANDGAILSAGKRIAAKGAAARKWMGKTARKSAASARGDLKGLLSGADDEAEALPAFEKLFDMAARVKGAGRHDFILDHLQELPEAYRAAAEVCERLPEDDELEEVCGEIDGILHGIISGEAFSVCREYTAYCRKNHIVSLNDMLLLTSALVREHPKVREELHKKYRTFFVDEYQDTDPVQTDILFAITAERYDPDWHRCVPRQGSLFLVGDAKQGIYRFRGADISLWQEAAEAMEKTGGEVVNLYRNFRSTDEVCGAVTRVFGPSGPLAMAGGAYQAGYAEMTAVRGHGPEAVWHHRLEAETEAEGHGMAAEQVAQMIEDRVRSGQNCYGDFLLLSFYRERHMAYPAAFRKRGIPLKFDGALPMEAYLPIQLLHLRVQAVCHPFDESVLFRVMGQCGGVTPEEWDMFRMRLQGLPGEADVPSARDIRTLAQWTDRLRELLPDTPMNGRVLHALDMLRKDRQLSRSLAPCTFLEKLVEGTEGIFVTACDAEEFRNQYAALLQTIDTIREKNPRHFADMAEMLKTLAETEMDRMPSVRADRNFVRLMNLHKAKGLQGKVVVFLPGSVSGPRADTHVERVGMDTLGWFEISDRDSFTSPKYAPPDWAERKAEETEFLRAEQVRLKYVALTRAEDEVHIFTVDTSSSRKKAGAWEGFENVGEPAEAIEVRPAEEGSASSPSRGEAEEAAAEQARLAEAAEAVRKKHCARLTPSSMDEGTSGEAQVKAEEAEGADAPGQPRGMLWGSLVHRAAELAVRSDCLSGESVREASLRSARELIGSELMEEKERRELALSDGAVSLEQIRAEMAGKVNEKLQFMADEDSAFRRIIRGARLYPEIPFTVSAGREQGGLYDALKPHVRGGEAERIEVTGTIDLALEDADGSFRILDYKTDRMIPADRGDAEAFHARLKKHYGAQMAIYSAVLEHLTGRPVRETILFSVV